MSKRLVLVGPAALLMATVLTLPGSASPGPQPSRPAVRRANGTWFLRNTLTTGAADRQFTFGNGFSGDIPLMCDFDGDGTDTPTIVRDGVWFVDSDGDGIADQTFAFGNPGDFPLCGDFNGSGHDQPIVYRGELWFWRDTLTTGAADHTIDYGLPNGDWPIVGDWTGVGHEGPGVVREQEWILRDAATSGVGDRTFTYGDGLSHNDYPIVGDWDGNGTDTPGVVRSGIVVSGLWLLRNTNDTGVADISFGYGNGTCNSNPDWPLVWNAAA